MPTGLVTRTTKSDKAGLNFPVSRVKSILMTLDGEQRVGDSAAVYMAAVLEYLTSEIIELSLNAAHAERKHRIQPRHMNIAFSEAGPVLNQPFKSALVTRSKILADEKLARTNQDRQHGLGMKQPKARKQSGKPLESATVKRSKPLAATELARINQDRQHGVGMKQPKARKQSRQPLESATVKRSKLLPATELTRINQDGQHGIGMNQTKERKQSRQPLESASVKRSRPLSNGKLSSGRKTVLETMVRPKSGKAKSLTGKGKVEKETVAKSAGGKSGKRQKKA